jgi:hypothetical protein
MSSSIVVGCIFFASYELLRVEELAVGSSADLIHDSWLQINKDGTRHVLAGTGLREEGIERIVASSNCLVRRHLPIRLDSMLEAKVNCTIN